MSDYSLKNELDRELEAVTGNPALVQITREVLQCQYEAAKKTLSKNTGANRISDLCSDMMDFAAETSRESPFRNQWGCSSGCAYCCTLRVDVSVPQAIIISQYLKKRLAPEQWSHLHCQLSDRVRIISAMTTDEHAVANLPCIFLQDDKTCQIYPVRPVRCATYNSTSAAQCKEGFENPTDQSITIPMDMVQKTVGNAVVAGIGMACFGQGLDNWSYELDSAVLHAMDTPHVSETWLAGGKGFRSCITTGAETRYSDKDMREMIAKIEGSVEGKTGRNSPCHCGSGKKYKRCCMRSDSR